MCCHQSDDKDVDDQDRRPFEGVSDDSDADPDAKIDSEDDDDDDDDEGDESFEEEDGKNPICFY